MENGAHVLFGTRVAGCDVSEIELAKARSVSLKEGMLSLADQGFFGYEMWKREAFTGAALLWRARKDVLPPCQERLPDGSFFSQIYASDSDRNRKANGIRVLGD